MAELEIPGIAKLLACADHEEAIAKRADSKSSG
jgi:hypothetical protein